MPLKTWRRGQVEFNKDKCDRMHKCRAGNDWLGCNSAEKELGVAVNQKLKMSLQCALTRKETITCWPGLAGTSLQEKCFSNSEASPGLLCPVLDPSLQEKCGSVRKSPMERDKND